MRSGARNTDFELIRSLMLGAAAISLSGCSSGGGGGTGGAGLTTGPTTYTTSDRFSYSNAPVHAKGLTARMSGTGDFTGAAPIITSVTATTASGATNALVTVRDNTGPTTGIAPQILELSVPGGPNTGPMTGIMAGNGAGQYLAAADNCRTGPCTAEVALGNELGATALSYSYIGIGRVNTVTATTAESSVVALFGGQETGTDMPTRGTATYRGTFSANELAVSPTRNLSTSTSLNGSTDLSVDFSGKTVAGTVSQIAATPLNPDGSTGPTSAWTNGIGFTGTISGSGYAGEAHLTAAGAPVAGSTGTIVGGFYGPAAAESVGAVAIETRSTDTTRLLVGDFATKKR